MLTISSVALERKSVCNRLRDMYSTYEDMPRARLQPTEAIMILLFCANLGMNAMSPNLY